jgi:hypothetical protein
MMQGLGNESPDCLHETLRIYTTSRSMAAQEETAIYCRWHPCYMLRATGIYAGQELYSGLRCPRGCGGCGRAEAGTVVNYPCAARTPSPLTPASPTHRPVRTAYLYPAGPIPPAPLEHWRWTNSTTPQLRAIEPRTRSADRLSHRHRQPRRQRRMLRRPRRQP